MENELFIDGNYSANLIDSALDFCLCLQLSIKVVNTEWLELPVSLDVSF